MLRAHDRRVGCAPWPVGRRGATQSDWIDLPFTHQERDSLKMLGVVRTKAHSPLNFLEAYAARIVWGNRRMARNG